MDVQIRPGAVETVQDIYAAFGRGDVQAILDRLADDVRWEHWEDNTAQKAGVPTMRGGTGKEAVAAFFEEVAKLALTEFTLLDVMGSDRQVAVEVLFDAATPAGHRVRDEEMHLWTLNASGMVTRFRHYIDTAKHIRASGLAGELQRSAAV